MIHNRKITLGALSVLALAALALFAKMHVSPLALKPSALHAPPVVTISKL